MLNEDQLEQYLNYLQNHDNLIMFDNNILHRLIFGREFLFLDHALNFSEPVFKRNEANITYVRYTLPNSDWIINLVWIKKKHIIARFLVSMMELDRQLKIVYKDEYLDIKKNLEVDDIREASLDKVVKIR